MNDPVTDTALAFQRLAALREFLALTKGTGDARAFLAGKPHVAKRQELMLRLLNKPIARAYCSVGDLNNAVAFVLNQDGRDIRDGVVAAIRSL